MSEDNEEAIKKKIYEDNSHYKITEVISTIKIAILMENLFGIFRYSVVDGKLLLTNRKMKLFAILMPSAVIFLFILATKKSNHEVDLITNMDISLSLMALIHYTMSAIITTFLLSRPCVRIFEAFANLDAMISIQTTPEFYKEGTRETKYYIIMLAVFHIVNCILDFATEDAPILTKLIIVILYFLENLEILIFCKLIAMLKCRLQIINRNLTIFIQGNDRTSAFNTIIFTLCNAKVEPENKFNWIGRASVNNMKIRDLATVYDMIGNICSLINDVSNFQIFMALVSTFSYLLIAIWSTIYYFRKPEYTIQWLITVVIWCAASVSTVAVMSITCERLLSMRNYTKIVVNEIIMDYNLPKTMRVQAKAFMQLIEAWPLRILIYDMFSIDITLLLKFISVATTYLIIVIQISHFV